MKTLTRDQLLKMMNEEQAFTLVNVLSEGAFQQAHIPGSVKVPLGDEAFLEKVERTAGGKDGNVIVYCASFECDASPKAARRLEEAGFRQVYDFEGGVKDWKEGGYSLEGAAR